MPRRALSLSTCLLAVVVYAVGFAIYFISRAIRGHQGIELDLAYQELPPE